MDELLQGAAGKQWKRIGVRHHHGLCFPLFSLHSATSCGVGEFPDLLPMITFCKEVGMDVIQLLPLNDTGMGTSPYSAISAFALNPLHLGLTRLPWVEKVPKARDKLAKMRYWNTTPRVKYPIVRELKTAFLKEYYAAVYPEIAALPDYQTFLQTHDWLQPYALFKALKENQFWKEWEDWPTSLKSPSQTTYDQLLIEHGQAMQFHEMCQYLCFKQMQEVKETAEREGVFLKGDIPILISRDSADVWHNRHLFLMNFSAGAPPDMYVREGQDWGFPTYDWEALQRSDYAWWRERLSLASHLYHLYRIDHIVGFYRIWTIPSGHTPKEGSFLPADESVWIDHGHKLMEMMLESAPHLLPIGEDLGTVPDTVKEDLASLGICGTKMMRWERDFAPGGSFYPPKEYTPVSMTTVSTHDSDTLQLWWRHYPKEARLFSKFKGWDYRPFLSLDRHKEILEEAHTSGSLFHINLIQEYLALFPELVSPHLGDERINIPGKILDTNWTYRCVPSVEQLLAHTKLKKAIREILR